MPSEKIRKTLFAILAFLAVFFSQVFMFRVRADVVWLASVVSMGMGFAFYLVYVACTSSRVSPFQRIVWMVVAGLFIAMVLVLCQFVLSFPKACP